MGRKRVAKKKTTTPERIEETEEAVFKYLTSDVAVERAT